MRKRICNSLRFNMHVIRQRYLYMFQTGEFPNIFIENFTRDFHTMLHIKTDLV